MKPDIVDKAFDELGQSDSNTIHWSSVLLSNTFAGLSTAGAKELLAAIGQRMQFDDARKWRSVVSLSRRLHHEEMKKRERTFTT